MGKLLLPLIGKPKPKVQWYKGEDSFVFNIKDAKRTDADTYRVKVKNQGGEKICKIRAVILDKPSPPAGPLEYKDIQANQLLLSWKMPEEDGGSPTTNYIVLMKQREAESWRCIADTVVRTTLLVKKLTRGATYLFKIFAENRFGKSDALVGSPCTVDFPFKHPGAPGAPTAKHVSRELVILQWDAPLQDGGDKITG